MCDLQNWFFLLNSSTYIIYIVFIINFIWFSHIHVNGLSSRFCIILLCTNIEFEYIFTIFRTNTVCFFHFCFFFNFSNLISLYIIDLLAVLVILLAILLKVFVRLLVCLMIAKIFVINVKKNGYNMIRMAVVIIMVDNHRHRWIVKNI